MVRLEEWMEILLLSRQGLSISEIARRTGRSRPTVRRQLRQSGP
jgi:transposase